MSTKCAGNIRCFTFCRLFFFGRLSQVAPFVCKRPSFSESPYEARRDACKQISHLSSSFTGCEDGEIGCERTPYVSNDDYDVGDDDLPMPMTMLRMGAFGW